MSLHLTHGSDKPPGFPRASGDEPGVKDFDKMAEAFSPRERG